MKLPAYLRALASKFLHRDQTADDMCTELHSHIQLRADDLERSGLTRADAERRARIEFGAQERYREECNEALGGNFFEVLLHDIRYSARVLRKSPGFTLVAVATLALAIGANSVVFGVLNAIALRPLHLPREDSLYSIERGSNGFMSYLDYRDVRDRQRSFDQLAAFNITQVALDTGKDPSRVWAYEISGNYFQMLGIRPHLGRFLQASDEHGVNSVPYIVLSYSYWHTHFNDDPDVVGRTVQLNRHPYTIIGVTPPDFLGTLLFLSPDFYVPLVNHDELGGNEELNARSEHWMFQALGHLRPGVTPAQAAADLNAIGGQLQKQYPKEEPQWKFHLARPGLYGTYLGNPIKAFLAGLMLLAVLILLAACANLGSLFAARASDRAREVALRMALGSSRTRVLRQLLTEALLISCVGGALGLLGSIVLLRRLSEWQPFPRFPMRMPVAPDATVYVVAAFLAIVSGILFGIVPVRQVLHTNPYEVVKLGSTGMVGRRVTLRDVLLVVQIAICAVLVTSSMVAVRGLLRSLHGSFGVSPDNVIVADIDLSMAGYRGDSAAIMQKRVFDAMQTIPGVQAVGFIDQTPLSMNGVLVPVYTDKTTEFIASTAAANSWLYRASPGYFEAAGTSLLAGRTFSWHDDINSPPVVVVNREFARRMFGSVENGIGHYFKMRDGRLLQVVGIVEDGKYFNIAEDTMPALFLPITQSPWSETWVLVRSNDDTEQLASSVRTKLRELDRGLPAYIQPWSKELEGNLFPMRMAAVSLGILGVMGAMLSITGIFGMAAYSVSKRLREFGIRIALGAKPKEILQPALGRAIKLLAIGSGAGLLLGLLATRVLAAIVYQATPRDPLVLAGAVLAMALLGLLATWIPAQRALRVDPMMLLREE
jgi:predicted permease